MRNTVKITKLKKYVINNYDAPKEFWALRSETS